MDVMTIWKRKRPAGHGGWNAYDVATDAYGTWAFTPAGSTFVGRSGRGESTTCDVAQDARGRGRPCVVLLPATGWFVAHWVLEAEHLVNVDIATPPVRSGQDWSFDDLELDPFVLPDGTFGVEDEDEFAAACAADMITDHERSAALRTVEVLRDQLTSEGSPLLQAGRQYLDRALTLNVAPLLAPPGSPRF